MKVNNIVYALFIGLSIYCILNLYNGNNGFKAKDKVESYKNLLESNLEELRKINEKLTIEFDSLSSDKDMIKLKARALGYFKKEDHIVHISNWNPDYNEYNPGRIVKREYLSNVNMRPIRIFTFSGIIFSLIFFSLLSFMKKMDS